MHKNKNGKLRSQIHLYCKPDLYKDFKEAVKEYNEAENTDIGISELIRGFMADFIKQHHPNNKGGATDGV